MPRATHRMLNHLGRRALAAAGHQGRAWTGESLCLDLNLEAQLPALLEVQISIFRYPGPPAKSFRTG